MLADSSRMNRPLNLQPTVCLGCRADEELRRPLDPVVRAPSLGVVEGDPEAEAAVHDREPVELEAEHALSGRPVPAELGSRLHV